MISVVVGTFGDDRWKTLAETALKSVADQTVKADSVHHVHADTLQEARNQGAELATGEWLCFLDADDTLDPHYIEAMEKRIEQFGNEDALIQPSNRNSLDWPTGKAGEVAMIPRCDIFEGNFLIIGTLVKRETFLKVGGFRNINLYEDWDLWIRCFLTGIPYFTAPDAIYNVTINPEGRNNEPSRKEKLAAGSEIRRRYRR